jgi:MarR family transcriptional regulator, 2-MHQ and catechol-resistance regulon repressor
MQLSVRSLREDAQALRRALGELTRVYQFRDRDRICCHGLSVTQCHALEALVRRDGLTVNDLSAELFIDKSTVSRVVRGLDEKGLVARRPHPEDGRAVLLEPSPEGRRLHARIEEDMLAVEERILSEFDESVRREIPRLVAALARAAAEGVETSGGCCRMK